MHAGDMFEIPVTYALNGPSPMAKTLEFRVEILNANVESLAVLPGSAAVSGGYSVTGSTGNNLANVSVIAPGAMVIGDGEVARVRFRVKAGGAPIGHYPVSITLAGAYTGGALPVMLPLGVERGYVTIRPASHKDANADAAIDVVDVQSVVNFILGTASLTFEGQGDANGDLAVDVVDVQSIVNCILSTGNCD
jgi:hypothetical protein